MNTHRWLLPFTFGVDMQAIDDVVCLAEARGATLVAVSLVAAPDKPRSRGARLEHIQQSQDFLEALNYKASRLGISLERHEVFTADVMRSIRMLTRELQCDAIILVSRGEREALLHTYRLKHLLVEPPTALLLLRLPNQQERVPLGARVLSWLQRLTEAQEDTRPQRYMPEREEPLWIRMEEHHTG